MTEYQPSLDQPLLYQVALPRYLSHSLTYRFIVAPKPGSICKVPLQNQQAWGLILGETTQQNSQPLPSNKIKCVQECITHEIKLSSVFLSFLTKIASYYHYPLGLVFRMACPAPVLKKVRSLTPPESDTAPQSVEPLATLNEDQNLVLAAIMHDIPKNQLRHLIYGVTGSGKTEIYMHLAYAIHQQHKRCLIIVPEIALTPQFVKRLRARLPIRTAILHSGLTQSQHQKNWYEAFSNEPTLVIGTRSALFHPLPNLGMIIMDEEQDRSYKQNDHMRYHAREVAFFRSQLENIPLIFGSATPSYELLHLAKQNHVTTHVLHQRYGEIALPKIHILPTSKTPDQDGWISPELKFRMDAALLEGTQTLLYLNRKGFAPYLTCTHCHVTLQCVHCDTTLTYYKKYDRCICHVCGYRTPTPQSCQACGSPFMAYRGIGTEALEEEVKKVFPTARIIRIDRDNITTFKKLHDALSQVAEGTVDIVIGTQMLGKGHDFPKLRVVGILSGDQTLHFPDFRSVEWTAQALHQISGRAGRKGIGEVFLQSHKPDQPLLQLICHSSYEEIFQQEYEKRKQYELPPHWQMARFVFDASSLDSGLTRLQPLWHHLQQRVPKQGVCVYPPTPCLMERIAKVYRVQLLIKATTHTQLHQTISAVLHWCKNHVKQRYILDIGPQQFL